MYFHTVPNGNDLGVHMMNLFEFVWQFYRFEDEIVDEYRWWPKKGVPDARIASEAWKHDISYCVYMRTRQLNAARKKYGKVQSRATPQSLGVEEMSADADQMPKLVDFPYGYPRPAPDESFGGTEAGGRQPRFLNE